MDSFVLISTFGLFSTFADTTYTTLGGPVNLVQGAGLQNLTVTTAINTTNQASGIALITDNSWSTAIANLGQPGTSASYPGMTLEGSFGGGTYFAPGSGIILIGVGGPGGSAWGSWAIRLLLSDNSYSAFVNFNNSDLFKNDTVLTQTSSQIFRNNFGDVITAGGNITYYQELDIPSFDPGNIGFKGIEVSNMSFDFPDLTYIGVTGVPEPSALSLLTVGLGVVALRRRRRSAV